MSHYRPNQSNNFARNPHPLPPRPPDFSERQRRSRSRSPPPMRHFGGDGYRRDAYRGDAHRGDGYRGDTYRGDTYRSRSPVRYRSYDDRYSHSRYSGSRHSDRHDHQDDFTFQSDRNAPRFPPQESLATPQIRRTKNPNRANRNWRGNKSKLASHRPLLNSNRETTPEQMNGMADGHARFMAPEDVSESEAEMDLGSDEDDVTGENEDSSNKQSKTVKQNANDGDSVPRWSNPDPYAILPPTGDSQGKKKDVVKLIRKAKLVTANAESTNPIIADDLDFISLSFEDEPQEVVTTSDYPSGLLQKMGGSHEVKELSSISVDKSVLEGPVSMLPPQGHWTPINRTDSTPATASTDLKRLPTQACSPDLIPPRAPAIKRNNAWPPPDANTAIRGQKRPAQEPLPPPSRPKNRKGAQLNKGEVLPEWRPRIDSSPTPWCTEDHSKVKKMGIWLHREILDFYDFAKPQEFERKVRDDLIDRIERVVALKYKGRIQTFGSFAAGLYLPTADIDLAFNSISYLNQHVKEFGKNNGFYYQFRHLLESQNLATQVEIVANARVPLVKFVDKLTGIRVDVSFENTTGTAANRTFHEWKVEHPAMPIIVPLVKQFLLMRGLNEVFSGGIGGFTVTCLVTSLLQLMPAVQSKDMAETEYLADILMEFFDLYGNKFDIATTAISMRPAGYLPKARLNDNETRLSIENPNMQGSDISSGSKDVLLVFKCFSEALKGLWNRMLLLHDSDFSSRQGKSILGSILAGNYSSFIEQRKRLKKIHDDSPAIQNR
ncbi:hypothetical protein M501DRAFT_1000274 [Patellaria atrata CBS 101060]|uniref:polynucleotide adenylyltransferase n=1 Tax=Patellaria atrata CBS 101060 TaxID=1346257 RepID=A0A9P4SF02_9PEZI|nr:hypothetical protein M501DRAFT_1000274 [Patellaria atrata CBS 101060]